MIRVKETLIRHASDVIQWLEGTGLDDQQVPVMTPLQIELDKQQEIPGISLLHKGGHSIIWRNQQTGPDPLQQLIETGRASEQQRQRPAELSYQLKGSIIDPAGHFNPRLFAKTCGNNSYPAVKLYRTPMATRLSQQKQLQGVLQFQKLPSETEAKSASWALVKLAVSVSATGDNFIFKAQADRNGYFRIPLTRLASSMLSSGFSALFSVKADKAQSEREIPDLEAMMDVEINEAGTSNFALNHNVIATEENRLLKFRFVAGFDGVSTLELKSP
jgi:hypothetical protein